MTRHNIHLGRILGIPVGFDYSWFVIFALLTWMLAGNYYPAEFTGNEGDMTTKAGEICRFQVHDECDHPITARHRS